MSGQSDRGRPAPDYEDDEDGGFDLGIVRDYLAYCGRALLRRWRTAALVFGLTTGLAAAVIQILPRSYVSQTRILAQRNQIIAALGNPYRMLPSEADAPTRAASETVKRHQNLVALIRQTHLLDEWPKRRNFVGRLKDRVRGFFVGPMGAVDLEDALVTMLRERLTVYTGGEGTVTIQVEWSDADMAYRIVQAAQENFLESRHLVEISVIADSIALLEQNAGGMRGDVAAVIAEYGSKRRRGGKGADPTPAPVFTVPAPADEEEAGGVDVAAIRAQVIAKRNAVKDLEDYRNRRLGELQAQLAEQSTVYAASHPSVLNLRQSIDALSQESPGLAAARRELEDAEADYAGRTGRSFADEPLAARARPALYPVEPLRLAIEPGSKVEPDEEYARQRMNAVVGRYNTLLERVAGAQMELDAARAAFKYRYVVIEPARPPKNPARPNAIKLFALALAGALGAGFLAAVLAEARDGLVVQSWQIHRSLGVPLLTEVTLSPRGR